MEAAQSLTWPNSNVYGPPKPAAAKATSLLAVGKHLPVHMFCGALEFLTKSVVGGVNSQFAQLWGEISAFLSLSCSSAVVLAPPLHVWATHRGLLPWGCLGALSEDSVDIAWLPEWGSPMVTDVPGISGVRVSDPTDDETQESQWPQVWETKPWCEPFLALGHLHKMASPSRGLSNSSSRCVCGPAPVGAFQGPEGQGQCTRREAAMAAPPPYHLEMACWFCVSVGFFRKHSWLQISSPHPLRLSPCIQEQFSLRLLPSLRVPAPSLHAHCWAHVPGKGAQECDRPSVWISLVLSCPDQHICFPLTAPDALLLSQLTSPGRRGFLECGHLSLLLQLPYSKGMGPLHFLPSFFFPSLYFLLPSYAGSFLSLWCSRSASVQLVCENCSICRCSLDAFVEERWTPHSPTHPPSCFFLFVYLFLDLVFISFVSWAFFHFFKVIQLLYSRIFVHVSCNV